MHIVHLRSCEYDRSTGELNEEGKQQIDGLAKLTFCLSQEWDLRRKLFEDLREVVWTAGWDGYGRLLNNYYLGAPAIIFFKGSTDIVHENAMRKAAEALAAELAEFFDAEPEVQRFNGEFSFIGRGAAVVLGDDGLEVIPTHGRGGSPPQLEIADHDRRHDMLARMDDNGSGIFLETAFTPRNARIIDSVLREKLFPDREP